MTIEIFEIIGTLAGGAFSGGLLTFLISKKKQTSDDFTKVVEIFKEDNIRLRKKEDENYVRILELEKRLMTVQHKLTLMESAHLDLPVPMWLKDLDGTMLVVNDMYVKVFLNILNRTSDDYIGKKDTDIWPIEIAEMFRKNDLKAIELGMVDTIEKIWRGGTLYEDWRVIKYVRKINNVPIGIGGIAIPMFKNSN